MAEDDHQSLTLDDYSMSLLRLIDKARLDVKVIEINYAYLIQTDQTPRNNVVPGMALKMLDVQRLEHLLIQHIFTLKQMMEVQRTEAWHVTLSAQDLELIEGLEKEIKEGRLRMPFIAPFEYGYITAQIVEQIYHEQEATGTY